MKRWLAAIIVASSASLWHVRWDAGDYDSLVTVTECKGKTPFYAYDQQPLLEIGQDTADVRRQLTPAGARCTVQFSLMRPDDSIGDSIIVTQED